MNREERQLIWLVKVLAVLMLILIIVELCQCSKANASMIPQEIGYSKYHAPQRDVELLANVMYHENGMNDYWSMYYTGAVVMNRVYSKSWPNTVEGVLYQKGQYATTGRFFTKEIPQECYDIARDILEKGTLDVPRNVIYQAMFKQGKGVWKSIPSSYAPTVDIEYFCYE